ncbi:MAG: hypothetical protein ACOYXB_08670 [Bacteroidota bacterium]
MSKTRFIFLFFSMLSVGSFLSGQSNFRIGAGLDPVLCFTSVSSTTEGLKSASARNWEVLNFKGGIKAYYETEALFGISLGAELSRKRFGFLHEEELGGGPVSLLGHSELYGIYFPAEVFITVAWSKEPYFQIAPFAGVAPGWDFSTYRNLTRLDTNYGYSYEFNSHDYPKRSFGTRVYAGLNIRTIINDLGYLEWGLSAGSDIGRFPPFNYSITLDENTWNYSESLGLIYLSVHLTYCFINFEIFDGRFLKRQYN